MGELAHKTGFSIDDINTIFLAIQTEDINDAFQPGHVLNFPKSGGWPPEIVKKFSASSEHSSIRGTINGGGDFI